MNNLSCCYIIILDTKFKNFLYKFATKWRIFLIKNLNLHIIKYWNICIYFFFGLWFIKIF